MSGDCHLLARRGNTDDAGLAPAFVQAFKGRAHDLEKAHVTRHTSHVTRHTLKVIRHWDTRHTSCITFVLPMHSKV